MMFQLVFTAYACQTCKGPVLVRNGRFSCQQCWNTDFNLERALILRDRAEDLVKYGK